MKIEMQPNEKVIDTWTILYETPNGGKYNGKLTVTNKNLLYDAKFDVSSKGLIEEALFVKWGSEDFVVIPKERITDVEVLKNFFQKKVILTLDNGSKHIFNYGMLNIDPVSNAILQR
ncbi:MAG: GRAM domain-containing protein [Bacteroidota bacterium]|nr:GRAM domain-containing protein [Bacteroidota bacterium]